MNAFDQHYATLFESRWDSLRNALLNGSSHVARINAFASDPLAALPNDASEVLPGCFKSGALQSPTGQTPLPYYIMDAASVLAARTLEAQPGDVVVDLCAAPGGKSLILAEALADQGELTLNDASGARRGRLRAVLEAYLPADMLQRITVTAHDASRWGLYHPNRYDRVLLDAPCSSEAHVLKNENALQQWTPARPKQLALRQGALLAAAIDSAKSGGRVVYSTCALDPRENDGVVTKMLKKRAGRVRVLTPNLPLGETTQHGQHILPDTTGFGPIYIAVLERTEPSTSRT